MENLIDCIENDIKNQIIKINKHKPLENLIGNKYISINILAISKTKFIDKTTRIFTK